MDSEEEIMENLNDIALNNIIENQRIFDLIHGIAQQKRKYTVQDRVDPFELYDENEFERRYRLSKALTWKVFHLIDGPNTLDPMVNSNNN